MVDEPSTLKIELMCWPATTFATRAEAQAACSVTSTDGRNRAASGVRVGKA
jgi:hypothetical protein